MPFAGVAVLSAVVASLIAPVFNLCARPTIIRSFPLATLSLGFFACVYLLGVAVLALQAPHFLAWAAAAALLIWSLLWWRSRPWFGRHRRLPPGSLELLPPGPWLDRQYYTKKGAKYGLIYKASHFTHPMVCIMNVDSALRLLKEHDDISLRSPKVEADRFLPCGFLRGMDPEHHTVYRRVVQSIITSQVVSAWEPTVVVDTAYAIDKMTADSSIIYTKPFLDELVLRSLSRLFFGICPATEDFQQLRAGYKVLRVAGNRRIANRWLPSERHAEQTFSQLTALLRRQRMGSCFLAELRQLPEFADEEQSLRILLLMLQLAGNDVAGLLQWLIKIVCDYPDEGKRLRAEVDQGVEQTSDSSLSKRFTLEALRCHQVEHLYRRVLKDINWEGYRIPKGWLLRICLSDAHRDPRIFRNPSDFRPDRFLDHPPTRTEFLPFGAYRRTCVGEGVTHALTRQFLCTIVGGWEWRQVGESHEDYRGWHWTPGSDFRVTVRPRSLAARP